MTLPINPAHVQCGDEIVINNHPVKVTHIEKDVNGFNTYVEDQGIKKYVFIPDQETVTLIR